MAAVVEPPVPAVVELAHLPVPALAQVVARRAHRLQLLLLARLQRPLLARLLVLARARLPVVAAHRVVERAVHQPLLRSRQSFSAAMAGSTPSPAPPTYEPVPRSR